MNMPAARFLGVCLGGAIGAGARYLLTGWVHGRLSAVFPWGTLVVNLAGSFLLAGLMHVALATGRVGPDLRVALAVGVLGGFTTYSTFSYETMTAVQEGAWGLATLNVAATVTGCLAAAFAGHWTARWLVGG